MSGHKEGINGSQLENLDRPNLKVISIMFAVNRHVPNGRQMGTPSCGKLSIESLSISPATLRYALPYVCETGAPKGMRSEVLN